MRMNERHTDGCCVVLPFVGVFFDDNAWVFFCELGRRSRLDCDVMTFDIHDWYKYKRHFFLRLDANAFLKSDRLMLGISRDTHSFTFPSWRGTKSTIPLVFGLAA